MPQSVFVVKGTAALLLSTCVIASLRAQSADLRDAPPREEPLLYARVPDISLTTATGAHGTLSQIAQGKPLLLAFVFTRCGGVCSPFLTSWRSADRALGERREYLRLVLSFDPRDTATDMSTFAHHYAVDQDDNWTFAIGDPAHIRRLAEATGFWWTWDEQQQQFDHPAMLAGIRNGRLVRLLVGGSMTSARLDELMREVSGEFVRSYPLPGRVPFRCVRYDAITGRMTLDWGFALLLIPVAATGIGTLAMFAAAARVRKE